MRCATGPVGQSILSEPEVQDKLAAVGAIFDFDFRKQLHGLTVYTTEEHPKDGALIVYADFDPNRLITLAKAMDGFQTTTNGSHVIYSWLDDKKKAKNGGEPRVCGAILGSRVIFGQDETHLADALDVIEGKTPSFSGKGVPGQPMANPSFCKACCSSLISTTPTRMRPFSKCPNPCASN